MVPAYLLAAWTLFTWGTRIRNASQDDEALAAFILPVLLTVLAVVTIVKPRRWVRLLALVASAAWLVRVPMILVSDHEAAFKAVHTSLAVITWALAAWALRSEARQAVPA